MKSVVRIPQQKRAMEKKDRIVEAAYKLFNEKGYYNTNTAEIAKEANVATGSVYSYFSDKKEIFIYSIDLYYNNIFKKLQECSVNCPTKNLSKIVEYYVYTFIEIHMMSRNFHKELAAQISLDKDVRKCAEKKEDWLIEKINTDLKIPGFNLLKYSKEVIIIISSILENTCHKFVYSDNSSFNKTILMNETIKCIIKILK